MGIASASMASTVSFYTSAYDQNKGGDHVIFAPTYTSSSPFSQDFGNAAGSEVVDLGQLYATNQVLRAQDWNDAPFSIDLTQVDPYAAGGSFTGSISGRITIIGSSAFITWTNTEISFTSPGQPGVTYTLDVDPSTHVPLYLDHQHLMATVSYSPAATAVPLPASMLGGAGLLGALGVGRAWASRRRR